MFELGYIKISKFIFVFFFKGKNFKKFIQLNKDDLGYGNFIRLI